MTDALRRKRGLGRGLAALLGDDAVVATTAPASNIQAPLEAGAAGQPATGSLTSAASGATMLPITALRSGRLQPRRSFDETALEELARSVKSHGLVQPILVRPLVPRNAEPHGASYEIVAGERRWRAAQKAQLHEVPVVVRSLDDGETLQLGLIENVQRADLTAIEEATAYRRLISEFGHTQEDVAETLGKSRPHVANMLRLLDLPVEVQALIESGRLSAGHGRALIGLPDAAFLARHVVERGFSVRQAEQLAAHCRAALAAGWDGKGLPPPAESAPAATSAKRAAAGGKTADAKALERRIETALGVKAELRQGRGEASELILHFRDFDQLDEAVRRLTRS